MVDIRYRFFRNAESAAKFAAKVNGEVFDSNHWEYELALRTVEYGEDYKEIFDYVVMWDNAELTNKRKIQLEKEQQVIDVFTKAYLIKDKEAAAAEIDLTDEEKELIRLGKVYKKRWRLRK